MGNHNYYNSFFIIIFHNHNYHHSCLSQHQLPQDWLHHRLWPRCWQAVHLPLQVPGCDLLRVLTGSLAERTRASPGAAPWSAPAGSTWMVTASGASALTHAPSTVPWPSSKPDKVSVQKHKIKIYQISISKEY